MPAKQLTIFLENQTGRLAEVAKILKDGNINLQGFSTTEARDYGILRLVVSDTEKARQMLKDAGFTTHVAEVICFSVQDRPGELFNILEILAAQKINIDYIYVIAGTRLVISVDDIAKAAAVLEEKGIQLC